MNITVHIMNNKISKTFSSEKKNLENKINLDLLSAIENNGKASQRHLSDKLSIALGLTNAYLKKCINKGLIKVKQIPKKRYFYYLTPEGFSEKSRLTFQFLTNSFDFFRQARDGCTKIFDNCKKKKYKNLAFIGKGDLLEIAILISKNYAFNIKIIKSTELINEKNFLHDALVILDLFEPQKIFNDAKNKINQKKILAPNLLRINFKN